MISIPLLAQPAAATTRQANLEGSHPSIIIAVYNGRTYLPDCLESVTQECRNFPGSEVIVVDNASTDGGPEWIASNYHQVRLLSNARNLGFAAACNQGAAAATGDVLVFLNQDTCVQPGWLAALVEGLSQCAGAGLVTSRLLWMSNPEQVHLCGQDIHYTGLVFGRGALGPADHCPRPGVVGAVSGASFAIRKALWERLGGFDPLFCMYFEETDLCWRAGQKGFTCWYVPGSVALHAATFKPSPRAAYYSVRNRIMMLVKHWKWPTLLILLPALLLTEVVEWALLFRLGRAYPAAKLRAAAWLVGHLGQVHRSRRSAQAGRKVSDRLLLHQCTPALAPRVISLGELGQAMIRFVNLLYRLNYRAALALTGWLKL